MQSMQTVSRIVTIVVAAALISASTLPLPAIEHLDRGVVALPQKDGRVYFGWRLLASDPLT